MSFADGTPMTSAKACLEKTTSACFVAGTLVHTKDGLKPIEDCQVGDLVLTFPDDVAPPHRSVAPFRLDEEYYYREVTQTFVHGDAEVVDMVYGQGGADGGRFERRVTPNHPVHVDGRGWTEVKDLKGMDRLFNRNFAHMLFIRNKPVRETARVYNIEVADFHTYFIDKFGMWVHNKKRELATPRFTDKLVTPEAAASLCRSSASNASARRSLR